MSMHKIVAFMTNGNAISYDVQKESWEASQWVESHGFLQFTTTKGSVVRLNLRYYVAVEFQYDNGLLAGKPN
jgi:hypothetical protein